MLNESDFIAAEQAQFEDQRILGCQRLPPVSIDPECIRQTPGIELIIFDAAGRLTFPVLLGAEWMNRIDNATAGLQLLDGHPVTRFDGHRDSAPELLQRFPRFRPTFAIV